MADVPAYVTIVTAGSALIGAIASPLVITYRESRQAKRDRIERGASDRRQACLDLMDAAQRFRTQVAGNVEYHGEEMSQRLEEARKLAALVQLNAVAIALLLPEKVSVIGQDLAAAAAELMEAAEKDTDLQQKAMIRSPDFSPLNATIDKFRRAVLADHGL
jgi:hypothetical protein